MNLKENESRKSRGEKKRGQKYVNKNLPVGVLKMGRSSVGKQTTF